MIYHTRDLRVQENNIIRIKMLSRLDRLKEIKLNKEDIIKAAQNAWDKASGKIKSLNIKDKLLNKPSQDDVWFVKIGDSDTIETVLVDEVTEKTILLCVKTLYGWSANAKRYELKDIKFIEQIGE